MESPTLVFYSRGFLRKRQAETLHVPTGEGESALEHPRRMLHAHHVAVAACSALDFNLWLFPPSIPRRLPRRRVPPLLDRRGAPLVPCPELEPFPLHGRQCLLQHDLPVGPVRAALQVDGERLAQGSGRK